MGVTYAAIDAYILRAQANPQPSKNRRMHERSAHKRTDLMKP